MASGNHLVLLEDVLVLMTERAEDLKLIEKCFYKVFKERVESECSQKYNIGVWT